MATVNWEAPAAWADAFAAGDFTAALANAGGLLSTATAVTNGTALEIYADLSVRLASLTPTAGGHLAFFLLPLLDDGTTYADGTTSTTATAQATASHFAGALALRAVAGAQNGMVRGIVLPPGTFKWYCINRAGASLAAGSGVNVVRYRTYGETVA